MLGALLRPRGTVNRRELFLLGLHRSSRSTELSCERLYMKYCDSQLDNTTGELFDRLALELQGVENLCLVDSSWLVSPDFKRRLEPLLAGVRQRGGRITQS
jgi:hypothetical protein